MVTAREASDCAEETVTVDDPVTLLFCEAFTRYDRPLRRMLQARGTLAADAEDIAQQAWMYAWRHRRRWNDLQHLQRSVWLRAQSRSIDLRRSPEHERVQPRAEFAEDALGLAPDVAEVVTDRDWRLQVLAQVKALPDSDRDLLLALVDGQTYEQLAALLGVTPGALRTKAHRARRKILNVQALLSAAGTVLSVIAWLPRTIRKVATGATPASSLVARAMIATAVWSVSAPLTTAPVVVRPENNTALEFPGGFVTDQVTGVPAPPGSAGDDPLAPTGVLAVTPTPGPQGATCLPGGAVCIDRKDPSASPSASAAPVNGQWVCVPAAGHYCASQDYVETCPWVNAAPDEVVYCESYGTPAVQPPPPSGSSPSPEPAPSPDNDPSPTSKGPGS